MDICLQIGYPPAKRQQNKQKTLNFSFITKIKSRQIIGIYVKHRPIRLLEEKIGENHWDHRAWQYQKQN